MVKKERRLFGESRVVKSKPEETGFQAKNEPPLRGSRLLSLFYFR